MFDGVCTPNISRLSRPYSASKTIFFFAKIMKLIFWSDLPQKIFDLVKSSIFTIFPMRGREPSESRFRRGIKNRGFNQIKTFLRQITQKKGFIILAKNKFWC